MATDRFGKDLGNGVLLSEVTPDVQLDPQKHKRRTNDTKKRRFKNGTVHSLEVEGGGVSRRPGCSRTLRPYAGSHDDIKRYTGIVLSIVVLLFYCICPRHSRAEAITLQQFVRKLNWFCCS